MSKVLDISIDVIVRLILVVLSIIIGVLFAFISIVGLSELYAVLIMFGLLVARIRLMFGWCISALDSLIEG